ncbi:MAG: enoyl-CoA hydratase/isomerase family protein [Acidobacteria bacterium]|nr:enoyl-CoA hydratase/isomerase family protein [Acidobacteriota bacterium]
MAVQRERRGAVQVLVLDRQEALNAFSPEQIDDLMAALADAAADPGVRAVVLTGAGRAFSAGADISRMAGMDVDGAREFAAQGHGMCNAIEDLPVPVIAAINGFALGGGCEVALACDIRLASDAAKMSQPEVALGIPPGWGGSQRLPRICGEGFAKRMILTGAMIGPDEALAAGLVSAVHPADDLLDAAVAMGEEIAQKSPSAVALSKRLIHAALGPREDLLAAEAEAFAQQFAHRERLEGMTAFLEKRPPSWAG